MQNMNSLLKFQISKNNPKMNRDQSNNQEKPKERFENKMKRILEKGMIG